MKATRIVCLVVERENGSFDVIDGKIVEKRLLHMLNEGHTYIACGQELFMKRLLEHPKTESPDDGS